MEKDKPVIVDTNILMSSLLKHSSDFLETLCKDADETDTPFVALTFEIDGLLYSGDQRLKKHLKSKGFNAFFVTIQPRRLKATKDQEVISYLWLRVRHLLLLS